MAALQRMRLSHPNEFLPKAIFFFFTSNNKRDWIDCFHMKAAAVYYTIFYRDANEKTLVVAENLLKAIAENCNFLIQKKDKPEPKQDEVTSTKTDDLNEDIMRTIDAIYLVMGFLQDIIKCIDYKESMEREKLDNYCMSRHGTHVVSDIAMLDNQLPLNLIINVVDNLQNAMEKIVTENKDNPRSSITTDKEIWSDVEKFKLAINEDNFVSLFSWYYSPFYADRNKIQVPNKNDLLQGKQLQNLLECLHHCIVVQLGSEEEQKLPTRHVWPIPTAKELVRAGVRFEANSDGLVAIKFAAPVLKLPALLFDSKLETVVMNLVALENSKRTRPVTRYFQLMNELVDDVHDVRVLKRFGVVRGKWKREEDVVDFVKRVDGFASYPSMYPAIDAVIENVKKYHDERMSKFLVRNRPAVTWVSSVAAASLILTAIFAAKRRRS